MIKRSFLALTAALFLFSVQVSQATSKHQRFTSILDSVEQVVFSMGADHVSDRLWNLLKLHHQEVLRHRYAKSTSIIDASEYARLINVLAMEFPEFKRLQGAKKQGLKGNGGKGTATGSIRGTVTASPNQERAWLIDMRLYDAALQFVAATETDRSGRYIFNDVAPGNYYIIAEDGSHQNDVKTITMANGNVPCQGGLGVGCELEDLTPIAVQPDEITSGVDFLLAQFSKLTIRVFSFFDEGLEAEIKLLDENGALVDSKLSYIGFSTNVDFFVPQPGIYYYVVEGFSFIDQGYPNIDCETGCELAQMQPIEINEGEALYLPYMQLTAHSKMAGKVSTNENEEVEFSGIKLFDSKDQLISIGYLRNGLDWASEPLQRDEYTAISDANGHAVQVYNGHNCTTGDMTSCDLNLADSISHDGVVDTAGIDFVLQPLATIYGVITPPDDTFEFPQNIDLELYDASFSRITNQRFYQIDGEVHYSISGADIGEHYLLAATYSTGPTPEFFDTIAPAIPCPVGLHENCDIEAATTPSIHITDNTSRYELNIQLQAGTEISGTVVDESGDPVTGAFVQSYHPLSGDNERTTRTNDQGEFTIRRVTSGINHLRASKDSSSWMVLPNIPCEWNSFEDCDLTQATEINVPFATQSTGHTLILPDDATLEVQIDHDLYAHGEKRIRVYDSSDSLVLQREFEGDFIKLKLEPGDYRVLIDQSEELLNKVYGAPSSCDVDCDLAFGSLINVSSDQLTQISVEMEAKMMVTAQFSGLPDMPWPNEVRLIWNQGGQVWVADQSVDSAFTIRVPWVDGTFTLRAMADGFLDYFHDDIYCKGCQFTATPIAVVPDTKLFVDLPMEELARIQGTVTDSAGSPLAGMSVVIWEETTPGVFNAVREVFTDEKGAYYAPVERDISYALSAKDPNARYLEMLFNDQLCGDVCDFFFAETVEASTAGEVIEADFQMIQPARITITKLLGLDGYDLPYSTLFLKSADGSLRNVAIRNYGPYWLPPTFEVPPGDYYLVADSSNHLTTVYPDINCEDTDFAACILSGGVISADEGQSVFIDDFDVHVFGQLKVKFTMDAPDVERQDIEFRLFNSDYTEVESKSDRYPPWEVMFENITPGTYYLGVDTTEDRKLIVPEYYDGVYCRQGLDVDCEIENATPIEITANNVVTISKSFQLQPRLKVTTVDAITGTPVNTDLRVFRESGRRVGLSFNKSVHEVLLGTGEFYVVAGDLGYGFRGYPDIPCSGTNISTCSGPLQPLVVEEDFADQVVLPVPLINGFSVYAYDLLTKEPAADIVLDLWTGSEPYLQSSSVTNAEGFATFNVSRGQAYWLSTDLEIGSPYDNELYDNHRCLLGSVFEGMCQLNPAQQFTLPQNTEPVLFEIGLESEFIFTDSFQLPGMF